MREEWTRMRYARDGQVPVGTRRDEAGSTRGDAVEELIERAQRAMEDER